MSQIDTMRENMEEKTGRKLGEWTGILAKAGLEKHGEMVKLLKSEHEVSHGYANFIVHAYRDGGDDDTPDPVDAQYSGKESLRPIYEGLMEQVQAFGEDVEIAPKKSYVSLRRAKQFALIQPSTKTRVDVGIKFADRSAEGRLEESGSWSQMVSHRVRLSEAGEVDDALIGWLREAYEEAG